MSTPSFNFGGGSNPFGSTPSSSSPFGKPATTTAGSSAVPATSIFGQASTGSAPSNPSGGLFSNPNSTSNGAQKPLFGGIPGSTPGSGAATPSLFGASTGTPATGGSIFGGGGGIATSRPETTQSSNIFGGGGSGGGFSFGQKKDEAPSGAAAQNTVGSSTQPQSGGLFGGSNKPTGASLFGNTATSAPAGSTTPAPAKSGGLFSFANSTTPAAPPPATGGLFGNMKPSGPSSNAPIPQPSNSLFGTNNAASSGTSSLFGGAKPAPSSGGSLFGGSKPATPATETATPTTSTAPQSKPLFGFPPKPSEPTQPTASANTSGTTSATTPAVSAAAPASGALFGMKPSTTSSSGPAPPATSGGLFAGLGHTSTASSATTPASTAAPVPASGGLFGSKPAEAGKSSNASATAPGTSGGLFAPKNPEAPKTASTNGSATGNTATATTSGGPSTGPLGASTAGPAPQLSRLKNKTMDEIITRWASDLSKYQKEFQDQAAKVAAWDRLLVDNGDKIQKLYNSTFEAERASAEVERQLTMVEGQQGEISEWLDRYEAEIDKMFSQQVGRAESMQAPDQERERTYKLAEKLTERLDDMGKDLGNMIQEINTASATLSQSSKPDDPAKVTAAQKAGQALKTHDRTNLENDSADAFYRSFMGRR